MTTAYPILDPRAPTLLTGGACALAVMTKAPRAGASKTRLVPPLTHAEAAALSACFLRDTTTNVAGVARDARASGVAVYTPPGAQRALADLLPAGFRLLAQRGEAFGDRLFHAAEDLLALGYESLCLIDADSPTLPAQLLADAARELARPGDRVVLGPSDDGGYCLIGLKRAHHRLFTGVAWSTARVLAQTVERAAEIDLEVVKLPAWYDVDDAATLARLCAELFAGGERDMRGAARGYSAPHTREYLARLISAEGRVRVWQETSARAAAARW
ncbi:MAG: TIGR04282 family arsenosugar biosynthesis glycosyltransferase [Acidobacteria bacterium]|nr:TIGR04282 family arsenosugar biosynthesis glycosyltransferase [Acidobacteriota bacterium]MCA1640703.1 TIGR04282 family arsenosugar biosynthesis glycosyltransferase [Acidobacteriota bacterium]